MSKKPLIISTDPGIDDVAAMTISFFADELDVDMLDTSFLVKVVLSAEFSSPDCSTKFSTDELTEYALLQMFPHVRATLASIMASAGLTPYLIPTNGIIQ